MTAPPSPSAAELRAEPFEGLEGLRAIVSFWRALLEVADVDPLCNGPDWVLPHAAAYADPRSLFGWTVSDAAGTPIALFAFRLEPKRGAFALRRAVLVADGTAETDYMDLLVRPGCEALAARLVLDLCAKRRGVDLVMLGCVRADSRVLAALYAELERRGLAHRELEVPCLAAALPDTFEAFVAGLKSRMRSKVRSAMRRAEEGGASFHWCHEPSELDTHLAGLMRLHTLRWEAAGEPGSFVHEGRRKFYGLVWKDLLALGRLRFCRLEQDGRPVAYQIGAVAGRTYYQVQEGYDTEHADARVATALRGLSIQRMIDEGLTSYDYMAGDSQHKRDWGGELRPCKAIAFGLPKLRSRLGYGARNLVERWQAARATKRDDS